MPVPKGVRYRMKDGVRLAFGPNGDVVEAKAMDSGATHTPAELKADAAKRKKRMSHHMNKMMRGG